MLVALMDITELKTVSVRALPERFGGGEQHPAQNPYPIYVQNSWKPAPRGAEYILIAYIGEYPLRATRHFKMT